MLRGVLGSGVIWGLGRGVWMRGAGGGGRGRRRRRGGQGAAEKVRKKSVREKGEFS